MLKQKALVRNQKQTIKGDSLYYERNTGFGEGYFNIELLDEEQNVILRGDHALINQKTDSALLTLNAQFIYITGDNDSVFVHADTLRASPDSAGFRELKAYYGVRLFKDDLQGMCDSLFYSTSDSILRLFDDPYSGQEKTSYRQIIWKYGQRINRLTRCICNKQPS